VVKITARQVAEPKPTHSQSSPRPSAASPTSTTRRRRGGGCGAARRLHRRNAFRCGRTPTAADLGFRSRKEIHEVRIIRDAEQAEPGVVRRTLTAARDQGR
jgi:hypothetical protein